MVSKLLPDRFRQKLLYLRLHGRWPNLTTPETFTEKVFWRKFHDRNPLFTDCSDKLKVRSYVAERVGPDVLVPLRFETADPNDLWKLDRWANSVIKANHGWRMMEIVGADEPSDREKERIIGECRGWLVTSHSGLNGEAHYAGIEPRILVESFVGDRDSVPLDCKVHCFRQEDGTTATAVQLIADRANSKSMRYYRGGLDERHVVREVGDGPPRIVDLPRGLIEDAVSKSELLSRAFDYVRVDWMIAGDRIYFSELTFTPGAGLSSSMGPELDRALGSLWTLRRQTAFKSLLQSTDEVFA